jgi:hypothetical protein
MTPEEQIAKWQRHARDLGIVLPRRYWELLLEHFRRAS